MQESIFYNVQWLEVREMRFFEKIYVVKWVMFLASFCGLWKLLLENLNLKEKLQKWNLESLIFSSKHFFLGLFWDVLTSVILNSFAADQPWWPFFLKKMKLQMMSACPTLQSCNRTCKNPVFQKSRRKKRLPRKRIIRFRRRQKQDWNYYLVFL